MASCIALWVDRHVGPKLTKFEGYSCATWRKRSVTFYFFHTFVYNFFPILLANVWKMKTWLETLSCTVTCTSLKFGEYNFSPSNFTLLSINCSNVSQNWIRSLRWSAMPSDSHTNTVNLRPICWSTQNAVRITFFLLIAGCELHSINLQYLETHQVLYNNRITCYILLCCSVVCVSQTKI